MPSVVRVDVHHRIRGDGRIRVDGAKTKVLRDTGGWYLVYGPYEWENARVLFHRFQDMALIEQYGRFLRVEFHAGEGTFEWQSRTYHIGTMVDGLLRIDREGHLMAYGRVTISGVRFEEVAMELTSIIRPLAWALTLRSEWIRRDL